MDHMTAKVSCFARAYHHKNNQVCIFDDPMAEKLLGNEYEQIAEHMAAGSMICFDYPSVDESKETRTNQTLASGAGEQMKALYSRKEMEALLQEM